MTARDKPTAIDLFSGCGGLTTGLKQAGFSIIAAVDTDPLAMSTYKMNHPRARHLLGDIRKVSAQGLMRDLGLKPGQLDLLAGCPPCQGFSTLRTMNGGKRVSDSMNDLIFQVTRFAGAFRPKALMIENVPGLVKDPRFQVFTKRLGKLGYKWSAGIQDAADYGVPQRRRRMILVALRGEAPALAAARRKRCTVKDAIGKLSTPAKSNDPLHNYEVTRASHVQEIIAEIPKNGGSRASLGKRRQLPCHRKLEGFHDVYGRMSWDEPSPTITGGCINPSKGRFLHPQQNRAITLREAALLQGFPESYRFSMERGRYPAAQMIGNAFPPGLAERHARGLLLGLTKTRRARRRK